MRANEKVTSVESRSFL